MDSYDLIIVGTGPAGYTASIYAVRYKVNHLLIGQVAGGLVGTSHKICNFPGYPDISGQELAQKFKDHIRALQVKEVSGEVEDIEKSGDTFIVTTQKNEKYETRTVILAIGTNRRKLNIPGEDKYLGKGVSYCATCDGAFFKDKVVAVVGGGDAANTTALYLADVAKKVIQICREGKLAGEVLWIEQVRRNPRIEVLYEKEAVELRGNGKLSSIILNDKSKIKADGVFIEIGSVPDKVLIESLKLKTDKDGYIVTDQAQKTSVEGVWAAGDITTGSNGFRQIITACAEGAVAARSVHEHLAQIRAS